MNKAITTPEVKAKLEDFGLEVLPGDGPALASFIQKETASGMRSSRSASSRPSSERGAAHAALDSGSAAHAALKPRFANHDSVRSFRSSLSASSPTWRMRPGSPPKTRR